MDTTEMFRQLREHVDKLHVLLKDPQRGLLTWNTLVGKEWKAIVELWERL